jgi:hypothetical protein
VVEQLTQLMHSTFLIKGDQMNLRLSGWDRPSGGRGRGVAAGALLATALAATPAGAAVMFAAGAGISLTVTGIDGNPDALSAVRIFATEARTEAATGVDGPNGDGALEETRRFAVEPADFGSAEATASAFALSRTLGPVGPTPTDLPIGTGLVQLAEIEGAASAVGGGVFDVSAEAAAFGSYDISNAWHEPIRVHFDYDLGLAATAKVDDPAIEVADAGASVEIRRSNTNGLVFADVVGAGEEGAATGSFFLDIAGGGSGNVTAFADAFGEATVVPLPATVWSLLAAVAGLGWLRRRQRAATAAA